MFLAGDIDDDSWTLIYWWLVVDDYISSHAPWQDRGTLESSCFMTNVFYARWTFGAQTQLKSERISIRIFGCGAGTCHVVTTWPDGKRRPSNPAPVLNSQENAPWSRIYSFGTSGSRRSVPVPLELRSYKYLSFMTLEFCNPLQFNLSLQYMVMWYTVRLLFSRLRLYEYRSFNRNIWLVSPELIIKSGRHFLTCERTI